MHTQILLLIDDTRTKTHCPSQQWKAIYTLRSRKTIAKKVKRHDAVNTTHSNLFMKSNNVHMYFRWYPSLSPALLLTNKNPMLLCQSETANVAVQHS